MDTSDLSDALELTEHIDAQIEEEISQATEQEVSDQIAPLVEDQVVQDTAIALLAERVNGIENRIDEVWQRLETSLSQTVEQTTEAPQEAVEQTEEVLPVEVDVPTVEQISQETQKQKRRFWINHPMKSRR